MSACSCTDKAAGTMATNRCEAQETLCKPTRSPSIASDCCHWTYKVLDLEQVQDTHASMSRCRRRPRSRLARLRDCVTDCSRQHADAYLTRRGSCIFQRHLTRPNKTSNHSADLHVHTNNSQNKILEASRAFPQASTPKLVMASYTYELIELGDDAHGLGCKCCRFSKGLDLPSPRKDLSTTEARKLALGFATSVLRDWTALNAILKRFEGKSNRSCA